MGIGFSATSTTTDHDGARLSVVTPAADVLVFEQGPGGVRLVGGTGRGASWAGIVEFVAADEPLAGRAWQSGVPVRVDDSAPRRIVGPYWAAHAILVPLGHEHLVVLGHPTSLDLTDGAAVRAAALAVAKTANVPAEKLLADELEVVHALRALMAYRPESVRETARHIATVAAQALSCDVGAVQVVHDATLEVIRATSGMAAEPAPPGPGADAYLLAVADLAAPRVEQSVGDGPRLFPDPVVSRLTVPIGIDSSMGALVLGHAEARPRGFTLLCQRIGRALAESAELLLAQAVARETLARERDEMERASRTDHLTGIGNRRHWDEATEDLRVSSAEPAGRRAMTVLSFDLDHLKQTNDTYGHAVGDTVLRAAAGVILAGVRESDIVARVGGDEFHVLLLDADVGDASKVAARIGRVARRWRVSEHQLSPELSAGWAVVEDDRIDEATDLADQRMYAAKRRRAHRREASAGVERLSTAGQRPDRRTKGRAEPPP